MITLQPASTRPIRLYPASKRGIEISAPNPNQPSPVIHLLKGPPGTVPGPMGEVSTAQANAIAEEAATRARTDPLLLVESLLNPGL